MEEITLIQHNVHNWNNNKFMLCNIYKTLTPDVILLNSHALAFNENITIHGYTTHKVNSSDERHDGSAILIKHNLKYKLKDH